MSEVISYLGFRYDLLIFKQRTEGKTGQTSPTVSSPALVDTLKSLPRTSGSLHS